jgi:PhnB protein
MAVKPIPEGFHSVTPALNVQGADKLIDFLGRAFGAKEISRMQAPGGPIMHGEVRIGDSMVMLSEAMEEGPTTSSLMLYVEDVDAVWKQAQEAGATSIMEPTDMFWGDRFARVKDAFGNRWGIATHKEDLSPEEIERRGREWMASIAPT